MNNFDESDQASLVAGLFGLHLRSKGHIDGQPNPDCAFCKGFIINNSPDTPALESYKFILLDVTDDTTT